MTTAKQTFVNDANLFMRKIALELVTRAAGKTPVDEGRAKGNWGVFLTNAKNSDESEDKSGKGSVSSSQVSKFVNKLGQFDILKHKSIFILNSMPYINVLEYGGYISKNPNPDTKITGGGFSKQAPAGMVRISVLEVKIEIPQIANAILRKNVTTK